MSLIHTFRVEVNCKDEYPRSQVKELLDDPECLDVSGEDVKDAYGELYDVIDWLAGKGIAADTRDCYLTLTGEIAGMP